MSELPVTDRKEMIQDMEEDEMGAKYTESQKKATLTSCEKEVPHFYKWRDELRITQRSLDFFILLHYYLSIISRIH